jgi:hypothetical protein
LGHAVLDNTEASQLQKYVNEKYSAKKKTDSAGALLQHEHKKVQHSNNATQ